MNELPGGTSETMSVTAALICRHHACDCQTTDLGLGPSAWRAVQRVHGVLVPLDAFVNPGGKILAPGMISGVLTHKLRGSSMR